MLLPHVLRAIASACAFLCVFGATVALAEPDVQGVVAAAPRPESQVTQQVGGSDVSLEATSFAIPVNSPYAFTGVASTTKKTDSVLMRLKVLNPSGKLMTQRTRIFNDPDPGEVSATFERETRDLGLSPGAYPVVLEVFVTTSGQTQQASIESELLIYDPDTDAVDVTLSVRISGQPLADPSGRFVADPGQYTRARDDARELATWVRNDPDARLTMALSPLLLEEWKRISEGYVFSGPEGMVSVAASSSVPLTYAAAIDALGQAVDTGRLELVTMGYTDPDLSELSAHGLGTDVTPQYAEGISAVFASLESTPSTGTIPAGGCLPPTAAVDVAEQGVSYAIVTSECTRSGASTATTGLYSIKGQKLRALVADRRTSARVAQGEARAVLDTAFTMHQNKTSMPLVISAEVGAGQAAARSVIECAAAVSAQPWTTLQIARDVAARKPRKSLALIPRERSTTAPEGYWDEVTQGRVWSRALSAAVGPSTADAVTAQRDSLVAQCSAWAGVKGEWALADRGRSFASTAVRLSRELLDTVELRVEPVTLAGPTGDVPLTIINGSDRPITVTVTGRPAGGVKVLGESATSVELPPKDTFIELPVAMSNSLSGQLTVSVSSGGLVLATEVVPIQASYLDRLVMIVGVVVVLGVLLFMVVRKARSVQDAEEPPTDPDNGSPSRRRNTSGESAEG